MWFVFLGIGLAVLAAAGTYVLVRLGGALRLVGASARTVRIVRWASAWFLFGYPALMIVAIVATAALGREQIVRLDGFVPSIVLAIPFIGAVLVALQAVPWLVAIDVAHLATRRRHPRRRAIA